MVKKSAKRRTTEDKIAAAEADARAEKARIRRLRDQQRAITALARQLRAAVRRADVERIAAARELCEDTGYAVYGVEQIEKITSSAESLRNENASLDRRVRELADLCAGQTRGAVTVESAAPDRDPVRF